jgi:hypothetical protein
MKENEVKPLDREHDNRNSMKTNASKIAEIAKVTGKGDC